MKQWTTQAEQRLSDYLAERVAREGFDGEDAAELREDLIRHIHEEAEQVEGPTIGVMHLENLLAKLDAGYNPPRDIPRGTKPPKSRGRLWKWLFGVILPFVVLVVEMLTGMCGGAFFNPIPTVWHAMWVAAVPVLNFWFLRGPGGGDLAKGVAAGFLMVTTFIYALLFLPMLHLSLIAVVFFGMGLLSLAPVISLVVSWRLTRAAKREAREPARFRGGWLTGGLAALLVMTALEGTALWTRANLGMAVEEGADREAAIRRLRALHSERTLLMACYEGVSGRQRTTDISGWITRVSEDPGLLFKGWSGPPDSEATRDVFFRVTGKPFNSMKPPVLSSIVRRGVDPMREFEFDEHLGGDHVAIRLRNLDLSDSRFDGHIDGVSRIGYGEWTLVFKNTSSQAKEARCQMRLPREGRVSRLTLWVNGEPREAAFSTVSKVKAAYKEVAVVQRLDPVLVNMVGPDTVMVQCFPVPGNGEMKIRLGITAPVTGDGWELPHIIERNFGLAKDLGHGLWIQGDRPFSLTGPDKKSTSHKDGGGQSLSAEIPDEQMMNPGTVISTDVPSGEPPVVFCEDRFAKPEERILVREPVLNEIPGAEKLVVVVDGSASVEAARHWITKALATQDAGRLVLLLADDTARAITLNDLGSSRFSGGRDNEPALREGIRLAREKGIPLVWLHGPQAVKLSRTEALLQLLERGTDRPVIHDVEIVSGPNRLAEAIYQTGCVRRGPSLSEPEHDLARFIRGLLEQ
ncbi:MAG: hypothetical protein EOP85_01985, partial [Verrucomicrobiaceae bacterium]